MCSFQVYSHDVNVRLITSKQYFLRLYSISFYASLDMFYTLPNSWTIRKMFLQIHQHFTACLQSTNICFGKRYQFVLAISC